MQLNEVDINVKNPGLLEVPSGKEVDQLPQSHFQDLIDRKGYDKVIRGLTNLEVWNKNKNPELSKWASDMADKLKKANHKDESYYNAFQQALDEINAKTTAKFSTKAWKFAKDVGGKLYKGAKDSVGRAGVTAQNAIVAGAAAPIGANIAMKYNNPDKSRKKDHKYSTSDVAAISTALRKNESQETMLDFFKKEKEERELKKEQELNKKRFKAGVSLAFITGVLSKMGLDHTISKSIVEKERISKLINKASKNMKVDLFQKSILNSNELTNLLKNKQALNKIDKIIERLKKFGAEDILKEIEYTGPVNYDKQIAFQGKGLLRILGRFLGWGIIFVIIYVFGNAGFNLVKKIIDNNSSKHEDFLIAANKVEALLEFARKPKKTNIDKIVDKANKASGDIPPENPTVAAKKKRTVKKGLKTKAQNKIKKAAEETAHYNRHLTNAATEGAEGIDLSKINKNKTKDIFKASNSMRNALKSAAFKGGLIGAGITAGLGATAYGIHKYRNRNNY